MSESVLNGYLYRRASLDEAEVRTLLQQQVFIGTKVYAFAANTFDIERIYTCDQLDDVHFTRDSIYFDFGHVFSEHAELRWKRINDHFDVLLLTERAIDPLSEYELCSQARHSVHIPPSTLGIVLNSTSNQKLSYIEYRAANGAVQLQRYTKLQ